MLTEGIGVYFASTSVLRAPNDTLLYGLPQSRDDYVWSCCDGFIIFDGGHSLVRPILERFGERGLAYLMGHPFVFPGGNLREAAVRYRARALEELARSKNR